MKLLNKEELKSKKKLLIISCIVWAGVILLSIWYFGVFNFLIKKDVLVDEGVGVNIAPIPKMMDKAVSTSTSDGEEKKSGDSENSEKVVQDKTIVSGKDDKVVFTPIINAPQNQLPYSDDPVFLKKINIKDVSKDVVNYNDFKIALFKKSSALKSVLPKMKDGMSCSRESFGWSSESVQCSAEITEDYPHGTSYFMINKAPFITGEANVICNNGTWVLTDSKFCEQITCHAQKVKWVGTGGQICQTSLLNSFENTSFTAEHMGFGNISGAMTAVCTQNGWRELEGSTCFSAKR